MDLGLPSGTKWATCNVGASKPSDYGQYFQWGDAKGYTASQIGTGSGQKKFASDWKDYKWYISGSGLDINFKKYTSPNDKLELVDDAAHVNMGGDWHMPSTEQIEELCSTANTTTTWTAQGGVNGWLFTSKSDSSKSIFFPAAGDAFDDSVQYSGSDGSVWSSTLNAVVGANCLNLNSNAAKPYGDFRYYGMSVRGVIG